MVYNGYMKRKLTVIAIILTLILPLFVQKTYADMGPKPSIELKFEGLDDHVYYVSVFSLPGTYGPNGSINDVKVSYGRGVPDEIQDQFFAYRASDNFCFWGVTQKITKEDNVFSWSYYAPEDFKVVVLLPDGRIIESEGMKKETFEAYYTCRITDNKVEVTESFNYLAAFGKLLLRMVATIVVELLIGFVFGYRSKPEIKRIVITNIITQLLLNLGVTVIDIYSGLLTALILMVPMEIIIFIIEGISYHGRLSGSKIKSWIYALLANGVTFYIGLWMLAII